ncbi:MAG: BatA and WFA domain-containing protein [Pirellulaceae bacterium]
MSFLNALGGWGWAAIAAVPPLIVLLYFLKLRRRPVQVPSTYLWKKALEDMHVNSLWQRLRNNLLMFLQILTVIIIGLACLRPGCEGVALEGNRFIFLVDKSASMSATDVEQGTRLDEAKRQIETMIKRMKPEDSAMLIAFSNQAEVIQSYTKSKSLLQQKLKAIEPTQRSTNIEEALVAASGLANPGRTLTEDGYQQLATGKEATLMIYSDGGFPNVDNFSMGNLKPEYHAIGSFDVPVNVGITAFSINDDPNVSEKREAFAQLRNASTTDQTVDLTLYVEDVLFDAQKSIRIPAGRTSGVSFPLTGLFESLAKATSIRLEIDTKDALAQDNTAFAVVNPPRKARLLIVTPGNDYFRLAVETDSIQRMAAIEFQNRDYLKNPEYGRKSALGEYDLVIYDQCQPETMPNCNTMFVGNSPPGADWKLGEKQYPTPIVDYLRTHPLLNSLQLTSLLILEGRKIEGPSGTVSLLDSTYGSIMAIGPRGGFQDLVMSFGMSELTESGEVQVNTDWPSKLSFPLFIQNVVVGLGGGARFLSGENVVPGQMARLRPPPVVTKVSVTAPTKQVTEVARDKNNNILYSQTESSGVYVVDPREFSTPESPERQLFAVNLFDQRETDIAVREALDIGFEQITAKTDVLPAVSEYWKWIVGLALLVLMLEWYIYNRRVLI